ncbi:DUF2795 domain-containing protein [Micromonospora deserti]|uniref:DUF2795 domain-containing protein n=1 Tax=Micromonospora deserti TaxID=2070366 RepID=A0A2W2CQ10_9ACTN|nr:DUF2795 domain-containing protein [Micromonospora deserti]PZG01556.1 hypothetical protein C1I99_06635 [Micromonospora deserti]
MARQRTYDHSDVKELMDNTGGWARSWDDVLRYLRGPAVRDADFSKQEVPVLIEDIERLRNENVPFDWDYRKAWAAISGEKTSDLPPPEGIKEPPTNPIELEDRYLKGLDFPAGKDAVLDRARRNEAPERVTQVLGRVKKKEFTDLAELLEAVGDLTWDHD